MTTAAFVLLAASTLAVQTAWAYRHVDYENDWDAPVNFECPEGQLLSTIYSYFSAYRADRRWYFTCRGAENYGNTYSSCEWSGWTNDFDAGAFYLCPPNTAIAGLASEHNNYFEDRRMKFKCCGHPNFKVGACQVTGNINSLTYDADYSTPSGKAIAGWVSEHFNAKNDRYFNMIVCPYTT
ncbi:hypothetical protein EGW08_020871 [Elysia chlorotica]|uniref:Dermatopontin n=1 Tax=Elysia chlorotica TaxID=188477 RepID=A0A3S1H3A9_ELYCH|nr:hypothetical protein EGW08_020871 [Elysia chlorotica]